MKVSFKLNGDYRDIRNLRNIRGLSIRELADMIPITESYLNLIENGKKNLYLDLYFRILSILNFEMNITTSLCTDELKENLKGKGCMYMKKSNLELAKQILLNHLEEKKNEWSADGVAAISSLTRVISTKKPVIKIVSEDYPVYDGTESGNYERVGDTFILDIEKLSKEIIENVKYIIDDAWSIPTIEGPRIDIYTILENDI